MAKKEPKNSSHAPVGYEVQLRQMTGTFRGAMDAAVCRHVVLGPICTSDALEEQQQKLEAEQAQGTDPEDPDEYRARNIFKAQAKQPTVGQLVDDAMAGIERDNPALEGVLPKEYAHHHQALVGRSH